MLEQSERLDKVSEFLCQNWQLTILTQCYGGDVGYYLKMVANYKEEKIITDKLDVLLNGMPYYQEFWMFAGIVVCNEAN